MCSVTISGCKAMTFLREISHSDGVTNCFALLQLSVFTLGCDQLRPCGHLSTLSKSVSIVVQWLVRSMVLALRAKS